jgi:aerobic carbon-monoxide dehydrogenase medium subunit
VFPADFQYVRAQSLAHALTVLAHEDAAVDLKVLAGGQSLLPMMKLRLAVPEVVLDIGGLTELAGVTSDGDRIRIGALTTYRALQRDDLIAARLPAMTDALAVLADQQVRARGTVGGCVAHGDPAADLPAVLLAMEASLTIASRDGTRAVTLDDFLQGVYATDLADSEIITEIAVSAAPPPGQAYEKFEQPASHLPLAGVCALVTVADGLITSARVAVTGVAGRVFRSFYTERALAGAPAEPDVLAAAADLAADGAEPLSDSRASGTFRLHLARVLARRALTRAVARATGDTTSRSVHKEGKVL